MRRVLSRSDGKYTKYRDSEPYSLGNLDLVNLRLNLPSEQEDSPRSRVFDKGSGDTYGEYQNCHSLQSKDIRYELKAGPHRNPGGYENRPKYKKAQRGLSSEDVVLIYSKDGSKKVIQTAPINQNDFLYPSKKKLGSRPTEYWKTGKTTERNHCLNAETVDSKNSFPFKVTPSGKLKVESSQVVFSSKKLSVLVADPKNTKVNIDPEPVSVKPSLEMAQHDHADFTKNSHTPMETLMSQAGGFSSLGSLIGNSPIRSPTKEASEYESKQTSEILDPELNLGRLGYSGSDVISWEKVKLPEKQNLYLELYHRITNNTAKAQLELVSNNNKLSAENHKKGLKLAAEKTEAPILYGARNFKRASLQLENKAVETTLRLQYLGVVFDHNLALSEPRRIQISQDQKTLANVAHSILLYAVPIWSQAIKICFSFRAVSMEAELGLAGIPPFTSKLKRDASNERHVFFHCEKRRLLIDAPHKAAGVTLTTHNCVEFMLISQDKDITDTLARNIVQERETKDTNIDLVEQCWAFIDNVDVFNEDTAFLLYMDAKKRNLPEVKELMLPRIQLFFLMLVSSQDWLELEVDDIKNLLKSNYIAVNWWRIGEASQMSIRKIKYSRRTKTSKGHDGSPGTNFPRILIMVESKVNNAPAPLEWCDNRYGEAGRAANAFKEIGRLEVDILEVGKMRWPGSSEILLWYRKGVAIIVNKDVDEAVLGFLPVSDRVALRKINAKPCKRDPKTHSKEEVIYLLRALMRRLKVKGKKMWLEDMDWECGIKEERHCEMEIFMSAVRWLKHDWQNRDKYKYEVLDCIRFGNIAPWQLVDIKRNPENPDFMDLAKDLRICKMIDDGLAYVIIKYWYGQENEDFQHWNTVLGLQEPPARNWNGPDKTYFTFREFLIYLDQYRRNQLIERNKPKLSEKPEKKPKEGKYVSEKNSPRIPTMEEFMTKKRANTQKKVNKVVS
ncbi:hypothetical protein HUJ04_001495 [Dendroctonus ponderosae]|nr:hypothetical protein HUJ04_001495 [Dendroctonus ponderosae]